MRKARRLIIMLLAVALTCVSTGAQTNRRKPSPAPVNRKPVPARTSTTAADSKLTGLYRLNPASSDDPRAAAERATVNQAFGLEQTEVDELTTRLTSPDQLSIERRGTTISIASTRAPRITFNADGRERIERATDGHTVRTRADLIGDQLSVSSSGSPDDQFRVTFVSLDEGRRLRVIRSITTAQTDRPVVVQSTYDRISSSARWSIYGEPETTRASGGNTTARNNPRPNPQPNNSRNNRPPTQPPVMSSRRTPQRPAPIETEPREPSDVYVLVIPSGTEFIATLDNDLTTESTREGDSFTMTVRAPAQFEGATIEGYVARVEAGGRISGRSEIVLDFQQIRLRDGRTAGFSGTVESVRAMNGEQVRVDAEGDGSIQERDSRSDTTAQRTAIGAAVGAIIGAIAKGGKGAAIGAAIGAGAGASSVYIQGRDDLELRRGTELAIRSGPSRNRR
jgi:YMGG-like Gly-zipper